MGFKEKDNLDSQASDIDRIESVPVPEETDPVQRCPLQDRKVINVTPKIELEYKVAIIDSSHNKYQPVSEDKLYATPVLVELSLNQDVPFPIFDAGAKLVVAGPGKIEFYTDENLTTKIDTSKPFSADQISESMILKIWAKGVGLGKCMLQLILEESSNGDFVNRAPATHEMTVVELKMNVFQQDVKALEKIQINPDVEPVASYHTALSNLVLPDQLILTDKEKASSGRTLHKQENNSFSRAKIELLKIDSSIWPAGTENYKILLSAETNSGALKIYDSEFDGNEIALPMRISRSSLSVNKVYWVEGGAVADMLGRIILSVGLDRDAGGVPNSPKIFGDWAKFTSVEISDVRLKVIADADKVEVWDVNRERFYVNLDGADDARNLKDKPGQRKVKIFAKLSKKIPDVVIHFCLVPDKKNWEKAHWGNDLPNTWEFKNIDRKLKHIDKSDPENLMHFSAKTDEDGVAVIDKLVLSRIGGDVFTLAAYLGQDPHLAKYVDGHVDLSKKKPVFAANKIHIWRKFHLQYTYNKNVVLPGRANTQAAFNKSFIEIKEVDEEQYDAATIPGLVEHELWQFNMSGSRRKVVCVGDINKAKFNHMYKAPTDTTKPKSHMVMCDVQWDSAVGPDRDYFLTSNTGVFGYKNAAGNDYLGVFDPPLAGGSIVVPGSSTWSWSDAAGKVHQGEITDANIAIKITRAFYGEVEVTIPAVCPIGCSCGAPGVAITPTAANSAVVHLKLNAATGPWAGESGLPGYPHCLIVINPNINRFNHTIAHEIGHLFKSVREDLGWHGMPDHPDQYRKRGGQGSHCKKDANEDAAEVDQLGNKQYKNGTCIMYHMATGNNAFCDNCSADMRVRDISDIFKD